MHLPLCSSTTSMKSPGCRSSSSFSAASNLYRACGARGMQTCNSIDRKQGFAKSANRCSRLSRGHAPPRAACHVCVHLSELDSSLCRQVMGEYSEDSAVALVGGLHGAVSGRTGTRRPVVYARPARESTTWERDNVRTLNTLVVAIVTGNCVRPLWYTDTKHPLARQSQASPVHGVAHTRKDGSVRQYRRFYADGRHQAQHKWH